MDHIQHFELPYKSRDRAKKFYFDAFDWQLFDLSGSGYTLANSVDTHPTGMPKRAGAINGGLTPRSDDVQGPTLLIHVGDVQAALDKIRRLGGTVLGKPWAMGPTFMARFRDPEGNIMGVFEDRAETSSTANSKSRSAPAAKSNASSPVAKEAKQPAKKSGKTSGKKAGTKRAAKAPSRRAKKKSAKKSGRKKR